MSSHSNLAQVGTAHSLPAAPLLFGNPSQLQRGVSDIGDKTRRAEQMVGLYPNGALSCVP
jgi:hypothetical protein